MGLASGIDPATYLFTVRDARDRWESYTTPGLPDFSYTVNMAPDSSVVSFWLFVDDATWVARGFNPNAGAFTYRRVYSDGVVA